MAIVKPGDQISQDFTNSQRPANVTIQDVQRVQNMPVVQNFIGELQDVVAMGPEIRYGFDKSMLAVLNAPKDEAIRDTVKQVAKDLETCLGGPVKFIVHGGIGGSELGASMGVYACGNGEAKYFPITSLNTDTIKKVMKEINPKETVVIKATRSNTTMETLAGFGVFEEYLKEKLPENEYKSHCVAIVDKKLGPKMKEQGYHTVPVEGNMSGRFTALHAANLLTMYLGGVDIDGLHEGARHMLGRCTSANTVDLNPALEVAVYTYIMNQEKGKNVLNAGIFSPDMVKYGDWLGQLVEESLNHRSDISVTTKTSELSNKAHSYFQGWLEGGNDAYHQFVFPINNKCGSEIVTNVKGVEGRTLREIEFAEYKGISEALANAGRPSYTTFMKEVNANALGQLVVRDMVATMFLGEMLGLRTEYIDGKATQIGYLNQPGVEAYKVLMRSQLANPEKLQGYMNAVAKQFD